MYPGQPRTSLPHPGCQAKYAVPELDAIDPLRLQFLGSRWNQQFHVDWSPYASHLVIPALDFFPGGYAAPQLICDEWVVR